MLTGLLLLWLLVMTVWAFRANKVVRYQRSGQLLKDIDALNQRIRALEGVPPYRDVRTEGET